MKVWHKLLLAPMVAVLFLLAVGVGAVVLMARQAIGFSDTVRVRVAGVEMIILAKDEAGHALADAYRLLTDAAELPADKARALAAGTVSRVDRLIEQQKAYRALPTVVPAQHPHIDLALQKMQALRNDLATSTQAVLADPATAKAAMRTADARYQDFLGAIHALSEHEKGLGFESARQGEAAFIRTVGAFVAMIVLAIATAVALTLITARGIVRPLHAAARAAARISQRDLTTDIVVAGRGETAELLQAQARMQQDLRRVVYEVVAGAHRVTETSAQIAQGTQDLSQRTEMQASTLQETASSMEELTSTVRQNADNALQASRMAAEAADVAREGGQVMGRVVQTMTGISDSSRRISEIISVIDGIAFQTNILALNAAVEAARAGDQGRGFAVVAAEVRNLAQRSATAAREIKALIGDSVGQVDTGVRLVESAGGTMQQIVEAVKQVSALIAEIAAAGEEQSSGIGQVNTAVTQMEQVLQQNASLVEEATAATASMKAQAEALLDVVSSFRLADSERAPVIEPIRTRARESLARPERGHVAAGWQQF